MKARVFCSELWEITGKAGVLLCRLRILAIPGAKPTKIRPPGMFCLIILQPDHLSKICMTLF